MFKKLFLSLASILVGFASFGQTIVPTTPQNKNIVLEEFTGIHCQYCPDGHRIAKEIQDAHPDNVSLINIHQGGYASPNSGEPDFRTPWGNAIVNQSYSGGNFGYPSGTINRHVFPGRSMATGGGSAMSRSFWAVSANEIMATPSNVNVAVEASINVQTRVLTVHVEAYYTGNAAQSTNLLNVALLQNNTKGPQTGGNAGNNYNHMHRLVDLITGQWGEIINTTTAGTFVDKTYTYTIPSSYNSIPVVLEDMEVVAYISETQQEIPNGNRARPTFTGLTLSNDANLRLIEAIDPTCTDTVTPVLNIKNQGQTTLTSLAINYEINGTPHTYNWTGNIPALWDEDIELPDTAFNLQATNNLSVSIPNDENNSNNTQSLTFDKAPEGTGTIKIEIMTDRWGNEFSWDIKDSSGNIVESGKNHGNSTTVNLRYNIAADCYTVSAYDKEGDGGCRITIRDTDGTKLFQVYGNWGSEKFGQFSSNGILGVSQSHLENVAIYPNPAQNILNISNAETADIQVYDILGRMVISKGNISLNEELNVSGLNAGAYFIKITKDGNTATRKFIVAK